MQYKDSGQSSRILKLTPAIDRNWSRSCLVVVERSSRGTEDGIKAIVSSVSRSLSLSYEKRRFRVEAPCSALWLGSTCLNSRFEPEEPECEVFGQASELEYRALVYRKLQKA